MRILEIILLLSAVILPILSSSKKVNMGSKFWTLGPIAIVLLHFFIEGGRWQMSPIYLLILILIYHLWKGQNFFKGSWFRKIGGGLLALLLVTLGYLFSTLLPVFDLTTPNGNYKVGARDFHLISEADEGITDDPSDKRELMIKVWYPADLAGEKKEVYLNKAERAGFAAKYGLPAWIFNYQDLIETNTYVEPKVHDGIFPLLIFSHGYYSHATAYYGLLEEIASHGFIVANINHTYESTGSLLPSGQQVLYDQNYDREQNNEAMAEMIWKSMQAYKKASTFNEKARAIEGTLQDYVAADITKRWSEDISTTLDHLFAWPVIARHVDEDMVGVFGHSQGGSAAGQALMDDVRIQAGINIDGVQWGAMLDTFLTRPFLSLSSDWPKEHADFNEVAYRNGSTSDLYFARIRGSGHSNFMDIPKMINLRAINEAGSIKHDEAIRITSKLVTAFFNQYLLNEDPSLESLATDFQELEIKKYVKTGR